MSAVREVRRYGGLPLFSPVVEGEGWDRDALGLPGKQLNLIQVSSRPELSHTRLCREAVACRACVLTVHQQQQAEQ